MILESIWFFLWGLLWALYFMTDGFDLGLGTLMPFLAKSEDDKRVIVNSMGPLWDGNEVWLLTAGGVTFAAFPSGVCGDVLILIYGPDADFICPDPAGGGV